MTVNHKGHLAELKVILDLVEKGYEVFKPLNDFSAVDLIAMEPRSGKLARLQIKHRTVSKYNSVSIECHSVVNGVRIPINRDLIDGWAIYCPQYPHICYVGSHEVAPFASGFTIRENLSKMARSGLLVDQLQFPDKLFLQRKRVDLSLSTV